MSPNSTSRRKPSFYWYDTETTGLRNSYDRIIQFAGQRTDLNLNPLGEPLCEYLQLPPEIVPTAESFQLTRIRPSTLVEQGIPEHELFLKLKSQLHTGNTCIIGYNNLSFDDIFVRFGMYRTLLPPYEHEHKKGNSRSDLLNIVRLTGALRPNGMEWPLVDGVPTFALGNLAEANNIAIDDAHDALADVNMTLALARKIKAAQPKLWNYAYTLRKQNTARELLDPKANRAVLHVSSKYGNARCCIAPVLPIAHHPEFNNRVIVVDLGSNIDLLLSKNSDELEQLLFERKETEETNESDERVNVNVVALNQTPVVAVLKTLQSENISRLNLDPDKIESNTWKLLREPNLAKTLRSVFSKRIPNATPSTAEEALYDGFISDYDQQQSTNFWDQIQKGMAWVSPQFEDYRLRELHARLKTKVAPHQLSPEEQQAYHQFIRKQLTRSDRNVHDVQKSIVKLLQKELIENEDRVLNELQQYLERIVSQYGI